MTEVAAYVGIFVPYTTLLFFAHPGVVPCMGRRDIRDLFATNLRRLRHERGLSQEALALEAGVGRSYMSRIEKGAYYASLRIIERLAVRLGVEPAEFLKVPSRRPKSRA